MLEVLGEPLYSGCPLSDPLFVGAIDDKKWDAV
jgi:hypothetical protein